MFPHERSLVEKMQGRPFVLIGVNNDDELERAQKSVKDNKLNWRSFWDGGNGPIVDAFQIRAFPTIMLIDHRGVIRFDSIRQNLDEEIEKLVVAAEDDGMIGEKLAPEFRTFRDKTGKFRIEAIAESGDGESVVLRKKDGTTLKVKLADLSKADQKYLGKVELQPIDDSADEEPAGGDAEPVTITGEPLRTFRDASGRFDVEARLVEIRGDEVVLEKDDGKQITVAIAKLDDDSREYIDQLRRH